MHAFSKSVSCSYLQHVEQLYCLCVVWGTFASAGAGATGLHFEAIVSILDNASTRIYIPVNHAAGTWALIPRNLVDPRVYGLFPPFVECLQVWDSRSSWGLDIRSDNEMVVAASIQLHHQ